MVQAAQTERAAEVLVAPGAASEALDSRVGELVTPGSIDVRVVQIEADGQLDVRGDPSAPVDEVRLPGKRGRWLVSTETDLHYCSKD